MKMLKYIFLLLFVFPVFAQTGDVTMTWDKPTLNTDNTPLTDLAGFYTYIWDSTKTTIPSDSISGKYLFYEHKKLTDAGLTIGNGKVKIGNVALFIWNNLAPIGGTFYTGVSAYDRSGNESKVIIIKFKLKINDTVAPLPPSNVSIVNILLGFFGITGIILLVFILRQKR